MIGSYSYIAYGFYDKELPVDGSLWKNVKISCEKGKKELKKGTYSTAAGAPVIVMFLSGGTSCPGTGSSKGE